MTRLSHLLITATLAISAGACTPLMYNTASLPPILSHEELDRPFVKLGRIQVTREVYITDLEVSPNIHEWGSTALREEAQRMGADAVIYPEISGKSQNVVILPATEYRASGVAIRFRDKSK